MAVARMRPDAGARPHLEPSRLGDAEAGERGPQALGRCQRGARDVGAPRVAREVLVRRKRRERRDVGRVVGGPARPGTARVEEALVGDDRAPHEADPLRVQRPGEGGQPGRPAGQVAVAVGARGEDRIPRAAQEDRAAQDAPPLDGRRGGGEVGLEAERGAQLDQRARAGDELHRGRGDPRGVRPEARHGDALAGSVDPPDEGRRAGVRAGEGRDGPLHLTCGVGRGDRTERGDGDERREERPSLATAYAVGWRSSSARSGSRWPAAATDLTKRVLSMRPL